MPRGSRGLKKRRLNWRNKKANRGTKGAYGGKRAFATWADVKQEIRRNATKVIVPPKDEKADEATPST
ncbi:MAG: hypothetical protein KIT58_08480 [Planctomycetota bacterium]|nr:hypothetical protein [Planctomycetota bacterium]